MAQREYLTTDRTYYVRTDGSNSNDGLSDTAQGAFATVQYAIDNVAGNIDPNKYLVTIQLGAGTYNETVTLRPHLSYQNVVIQGTSTYGEVVLTGVVCNFVQRWTIKDLELDNPSGPQCVYAGYGAHVDLQNVQFNRAATSHVTVQYGARISYNGDYRIVGNAPRHILCQSNASVRYSSLNCTLVGTPTFAVYFINASVCARIRCDNLTFTGTFTGKRYALAVLGVLSGTGGSSTYFPGTIAGTTETGAQYV